MTTETNIDGALAAALAKAQGEFPAISRDKEVTVQIKSGGTYKFKYAPLDSILNAVRKPLAANGLAITQLLDDGGLVTMLLHCDGGSLSGRVPLPQIDGNVQAFGSAITYLRRYSIQAILGIAAEEDDDGNQASGNTASFGKPREPDVETEELVSDLKRSGVVKPGTAPGYRLESRQGPDGHVIGFRLQTGAGEEASIPQVVVNGPAGEALFMASGANPASLASERITVEGRLFKVTLPVNGRKTSWFRLHVMKWATADYEYPAADEGLPEPPEDVSLIGEKPEAETAPLGLAG